MENDMEWSKSWKQSTDPVKQRKFRRNAPHHQRKRFVTAHLDESVRDNVGTRSLPVREGDEAEVMRGDWAGLSGRVESVDYEEYKVFLGGIERERVDGTDTRIALEPSNIKLTKLNLDDERRIKKYELSEEEKEEIEATEEEEDDTEASATEDEESFETEYDEVKGKAEESSDEPADDETAATAEEEPADEEADKGEKE